MVEDQSASAQLAKAFQEANRDFRTLLIAKGDGLFFAHLNVYSQHPRRGFEGRIDPFDFNHPAFPGRHQNRLRFVGQIVRGAIGPHRP